MHEQAAGIRASEHAMSLAGLRREDFPMLATGTKNAPFVYLDNAATAQKPQKVIDRIARFYEHENSNGVATAEAYATARATVARFLGASSPHEIVFAHGATDAIALAASRWGSANIGRGDEIVVTELEHHANLVPWQLLATANGATLRVAAVEGDGELRVDSVRKLLGERTKLVAIAHVSNVLGSVLPVKEISTAAHAAGARVLVDGAQAVAHFPVDVGDLGVDFYAFSAHKVFGPSGIGALYVNSEVMEQIPRWRGASVAERSSSETMSFAALPSFEAGVPNVAGALGLAAALDYVREIGFDEIVRHERALFAYARDRLRAIPGIRLVGTTDNQIGIQTFVIDGIGPEEIKALMAHNGVELQSGHFSAQPILRQYGLDSATRMSLAFYNSRDDVDAFVAVLDDRKGSIAR